MHLAALAPPSVGPLLVSMSAATRPQAMLFDIDGTLFNSDSLHCALHAFCRLASLHHSNTLTLRQPPCTDDVFREVLADEGFDGGEPISEAFFRERISGRANAAICADLFPDKSTEEAEAFSAMKEQRFRDLAASQLASLTTPGLQGLIRWIEQNGIRTAAVTNAPRPNAELMLRSISRLEWFEILVIGDECTAAKPDPEPYLEAMRKLGVEPSQCVALEDSPSGATAAVAAGVRGAHALPRRTARARPVSRAMPEQDGTTTSRWTRARCRAPNRVCVHAASVVC